MASLDEITASVDTLTTGLQAIKLKLDDIVALVASLKANQVSQAQIDALATKVAAAQTAADVVATEADSIG